jgi:hypothetical protein
MSRSVNLKLWKERQERKLFISCLTMVRGGKTHEDEEGGDMTLKRNMLYI